MVVSGKLGRGRSELRMKCSLAMQRRRGPKEKSDPRVDGAMIGLTATLLVTGGARA